MKVMPIIISVLVFATFCSSKQENARSLLSDGVGMTVFIDQLPMDVNTKSTVGELKQMYAEAKAVQIDQIALLFGGEELKDDDVELSDVGISAEATVDAQIHLFKKIIRNIRQKSPPWKSQSPLGEVDGLKGGGIEIKIEYDEDTEKQSRYLEEFKFTIQDEKIKQIRQFTNGATDEESGDTKCINIFSLEIVGADKHDRRRGLYLVTHIIRDDEMYRRMRWREPIPTKMYVGPCRDIESVTVSVW